MLNLEATVSCASGHAGDEGARCRVKVNGRECGQKIKGQAATRRCRACARGIYIEGICSFCGAMPTQDLTRRLLFGDIARAMHPCGVLTTGNLLKALGATEADHKWAEQRYPDRDARKVVLYAPGESVVDRSEPETVTALTSMNAIYQGRKWTTGSHAERQKRYRNRLRDERLAAEHQAWLDGLIEGVKDGRNQVA